MLQMPFYAGIAGLISYHGGSTGVSIAQVIAGFFVHISNVQTFPLFTCLSAVIVKLFVPSGGASGGSGADCNAGGPELYAGCVGRKGSNGTFLGQFLL